MRDIDRLKQEMKEAVNNSDEYKEYLYYKRVIERNPDLMRAVDEFRRRNFEIQNSEHVDDMYDIAENLNQEFDHVRSQRMVNNFLRAELSLCRMIQDICRDIISDIDFDMDFMD